MTYAYDFEPDPHVVKINLNLHVKYLGQKLFRTYRHTGPIALPGPLKRSVEIQQQQRSVRITHLISSHLTSSQLTSFLLN